MKAHSNGFKTDITKMGREIDSIITCLLDDDELVITGDEINSVTLNYQGGILKSVMKCLEIETTVNIPTETELNYKFGLKVNGSFEYLDYGNYIVYSNEKQEDTDSYKLVCYDKLLYSMVDYESIGITYPITIRNYINAICTHLGLTFKNANDTFANYDKQIPNELYLDSDNKSLGYTFRDVLDELAQVTASTICLNDNDELEIRYITYASSSTTNATGTSIYIDDAIQQGILYEGVNNITQTNNDLPFELELEYISQEDVETIDEEYLKDINVNFGEKYGPVNSIVLSRSAKSDNVYIQDDESVAQNGLCELKIIDNQIMNDNNRATYLPDILNKLDGLEYYINDFSSTGICYLDLCDRYNVKIGENIYSCVMFNDEINVTRGLEEIVYTDMPEESETDYTKADKTDRRINNVSLIVDKQAQEIKSLAEKVVDVSNTISQTGSITLENAYKGQLHNLTIKGQIGLLYPQNVNDLYGYRLAPSENVKPKDTLTPSVDVPFANEILYPSNSLYTQDTILLIDDNEYKLDLDYLNYIDNDICDEFVYEDGECYIIRRVGINSNGMKYELDNETIDYRKGIDLEVDSNSTITLKSFNNAILSSTYLLDNQYTDVFATQVELDSQIKQTADSINLEVRKKVNEDEIISTINQSAEEVKIQANKIALEGYTTINKGFSVDIDGNMTANNATFNGEINGGTIRVYDQSTELEPYIEVGRLFDDNIATSIWNKGVVCYDYNQDFDGTPIIRTETIDGYAELNGTQCNAYGFNNISLESKKKNFKKLSNALEILNNGDIYSYNWKTENDKDKKHIGFVIGDKFKTPKEVLSKNKEAIDQYSMISILWQVCKEQQEKIDKLQEEIENLKGGKL